MSVEKVEETKLSWEEGRTISKVLAQLAPACSAFCINQLLCGKGREKSKGESKHISAELVMRAEYAPGSVKLKVHYSIPHTTGIIKNAQPPKGCISLECSGADEQN